MAVPNADLRRPPITLAELRQARALLIAKGDRLPNEDRIFQTTEAQRRIEEQSAKRTRSARRQLGRRPSQIAKALRSPPAAPVDYSQPVIPYRGEEW